MTNNLSRRDFLKLASLLPLSLYLPSSITSADGDKPNILVVIFDSWSASNTSLYGYPRKTTPNIDRLAEKAIVYHNHYAGGHFTYPSTASFLTGVLPWEHKGYWDNPKEKILEEFSVKNLFHYLPDYYRSAFTHNDLANGLLLDMISGIDNYLQKSALSILPVEWFDRLFQKDWDISSISWIKNIEIGGDGFSNSLFLSRAYNPIQKAKISGYQELFPRGVPVQTKKDHFIIETATDWVVDSLEGSPAPFFSYIHMLPPHAPYRTRRDFINKFIPDEYKPVEKPLHPMGQEGLRYTYKELVRSRGMYDEFLLYIDSEFQRLMDNLSQKGILDNTIVILTSDHGEMFERGIVEHGEPSFHDPLMHIPLIIFPPDQQERIDIHSLTTTVDLLPTILHLTENSSPDWLEGAVLPPYDTEDRSKRTVFSVDFRRSPKSGPLTDGSIMIRSGDYKFTYLFGTQKKYQNLPDSTYYELFDLANDPEEMNNLFDPADSLSRTFLEMMEDKLRDKGLELVRYD